jgi:hypothetical protein
VGKTRCGQPVRVWCGCQWTLHREAKLWRLSHIVPTTPTSAPKRSASAHLLSKTLTHTSNTSSFLRAFLQTTHTTTDFTFCIRTTPQISTDAQSSSPGTYPASRRNLTSPVPANNYERRPRWVSSRRKAATMRTPHEHLCLAPARRIGHHQQPRTPTLLPRRAKTPTPTHPQPTQADNQTNTGVRRAQL